MNKLYTVIVLDALENPIDRIEVHCANVSQAYETASSVWKAKPTEVMWIWAKNTQNLLPKTGFLDIRPDFDQKATLSARKAQQSAV
jgi:hypothetical protein